MLATAIRRTEQNSFVLWHKSGVRCQLFRKCECGVETWWLVSTTANNYLHVMHAPAEYSLILAIRRDISFSKVLDISSSICPSLWIDAGAGIFDAYITKIRQR